MTNSNLQFDLDKFVVKKVVNNKKYPLKTRFRIYKSEGISGCQICKKMINTGIKVDDLDWGYDISQRPNYARFHLRCYYYHILDMLKEIKTKKKKGGEKYFKILGKSYDLEIKKLEKRKKMIERYKTEMMLEGLD